ncbi:MAG: PilZ domain-containing protein [Candidatus Omnitrophica bacterium]|nr:PilZ domain-containing protein [Candidatus Omnitrophota bacterium]
MPSQGELILYLYLLLLLSLIILLLILQQSHLRKKETFSSGKAIAVWSGKERRRFRRFKIDFSIKYEVSDKLKTHQEAPTRDISQGGLGLILYEKLKPGTPLRIWIDLPQNKGKLFVLGNVAWEKEVTREGDERRIFYVGVCFTAVDHLTQINLFNFISSLEEVEDERKVCGKA